MRLFLKKLYFLIYGYEIEGQNGRDAALAEALHAFKCLWNLKYATDDDGKKFSSYLQMVRSWRNDEAHNAPSSSDEEVNTGIRVVVALYLYVTAHSIRDLEMAGPDINRAVEATRYQLIESDTVGCLCGRRQASRLEPNGREVRKRGAEVRKRGL